MSRPLHETDKSYWHRFADVYERAFADVAPVRMILEFGVFQGDSIRWLAERYPGAQILGVDIVPQQPSWPVGKGIGYVRLDQGSVADLKRLFGHLKVRFDLVIEDGSHHPVHQRNCLVEAIPHVRPGGIYVLEDIHTAHPSHTLYQQVGRPNVVGPLHLLLALEHFKTRGVTPEAGALDRLSSNSLFTRADVEMLASRIQGIEIYKRATLPLKCYNCRTSDFDFAALRCA